MENQNRQEPDPGNEAEREKIRALFRQFRQGLENQTAKKEQGEKPVCDVVDDVLATILPKAEQNQTANQTATDQIQGRAIEDAKKTASITGTATQTANQKDKAENVFVPKRIHDLSDSVSKRRITKRHFKGLSTEPLPFYDGENEMKISYFDRWQVGDLEILSIDDKPKLGASFDKNIRALIYLTYKQQRDKPEAERKAEAEFTFAEYARIRGYSEDEIKGGFYDLLLTDLKMGTLLFFRFRPVDVEIKGRKYKCYSFPSFYDLFIPIGNNGRLIKGDKIKVWFRPVYAVNVLRVINQDKEQYLVHSLREIADRETTQKPYLHFFYNKLIGLKGQKQVKTSVEKLIKEIGVKQQIADRPGLTYEVLRECLIYFTEHYADLLSGVILYHDIKSKVLLPDDIRALPSDYERFKERYLTIIEADDIRAVQIQFLNDVKKIEKKKDDKASKEFVINEILQWCDECGFDWQELKIGKDGIKGMLNTYINCLGVDYVYGLYRDFERKHKNEARVFLFRTLKDHYEVSKRANREKVKKF